jgi:Zn-dependent M28 family amino/carboxypeptidase
MQCKSFGSILRLLNVFIGLFISVNGWSQSHLDSIRTSELKHIVYFLASDSFKGRDNYSPELDVAANFIAERFQQAGLQKLPGQPSFLKPFVTTKTMAYRPDSIPLNKKLYNVVGVLPGRSKEGEAVIFSAHYDHVGMNGLKESYEHAIHNGANDNASGTAALMVLANYFAGKANNERTLIFCAFAGEELGLLGSRSFAGNINPLHIKAVINIEMIGRTTVGKDAFFITGDNFSDLKKIMEKNMTGTGVRLRRDLSPAPGLFHRSDNYPFALKGIPAHTVMASSDEDPCYHQPCDDAGRIDFDNMTRLVRAIAAATTTLVNGTDTPTRINPKKLNY